VVSRHAATVRQLGRFGLLAFANPFPKFLETIVKIRRFERPVAIFVGLGFPREVDSVLEAYQVLTEWPSGSRGPAHGMALDSCRAALTDEVDGEAVRAAFEAFARERGILAPDALAQSAMAAAQEWIGEPALRN
jgi:hypothetical protein